MSDNKQPQGRHRNSASRSSRSGAGFVGGALPPQGGAAAAGSPPNTQLPAQPVGGNTGGPRRSHHAGSQSLSGPRRSGFGSMSGSNDNAAGTAASLYAPRGQGQMGGMQSAGGVADPTAAMDNLQNLIQSIKTTQGSNAAPEAQQDELSNLGARLAAQEDNLQYQLQQRLGRGPAGGGGGARGHASSHSISRGSGMLPSLGEDESLDSSAQQQATGGRLGSRFAGNAAFQSAIARHAANAGQPGSETGGLGNAHQRQRSLQERFADMGFAVPGAGDDTGDHFSGDRLASLGLNPAIGGLGDGQGDLSGRTGRHTPSGSVGGNLYAENMALQQQIEMLQLQQQQLLQQSINFTPSAALAGQTQSGRNLPSTNRANSHRRIQSYAPNAQPMGSFSTGAAPFQSNAIQHAQPQTNVATGRGHNRRHSLNALNKDNSSENLIPQADFAVPPPQNDPSLIAQTQPMRAGHFSHPSIQLSSLSPEYLMAGGGLVSLSALQAGLGDIADGFGGAGGFGGMRGHGRDASQSWRINGSQPQYGQTLDLAQAQAQLSSLNQFRAQASMPNAGRGANFVPGALGGPQQQQQQQGGPQRKALFGSYLPQASLPPLLAAGKIVVGVLRVNKRNRSDAWVATEVLQSDIFISGSKDRNRALDGDVVAVELLDPNEVWSIKKDKEDKKKRKEEQGPAPHIQHGHQGSISGGLRKPDKAKDDLEVEGSQMKLVDDEEDNEDAPPALAGHVVAIIERVPSKLFSGTIGLLRPSSAATKEKQQAERGGRDGNDKNGSPQQRPKIIWFRPSDKRCPLVAIPADQAPTDFWDDPDAYRDRLFMCSIKRWPLTSLHPFGTLVEELGVIGNRDALSAAIFKECLSIDETFGDGALKCLPPLPWSIPERELEARRDFRESCIFTIDPPTAKDLDDAVSVNRLEGGLYEIGVHIADVSYFVKIGSALDREARKRGTSVYMVERMIPMLPATLSEELCSLRPGVERLAYSVVFTINKDARVIGTWMGRSVIKSCGQLAYNDAQAVIDGNHIDAAKLKSHSVEQVEEDILVLHQLAQKMRSRRFENGAIRVDNVKLSFRLDEKGLPTDAFVYEQKEAHRLIEEFMLLANMSVAQQIAAGMPDLALLRRHEKPLERRIEGFERRAEQMGITNIDTSSGGALHKSLQSISDIGTRKTLEALVVKSMLRAKYFCTGMVDIAGYSHFALNVPLYTHFTSPIRRYADVMVHRQLDAVLNNATDRFPVDAEGVAKIAQQCNVKRDAAKLAQEQSDHLFLCLMIHDLTVRYGPVVRKATVMGVLDAAFDVIVHEFGTEKRVHVDQIPIEHHSYDDVDGTLSLWWKRGKDTIEWLTEQSNDEHVAGINAIAQQHKQKRQAPAEGIQQTSASADAEAALFDDDDADDEDRAIAEVKRRTHNGEDAEGSTQRTQSFKRGTIECQGAKISNDGHCVQRIKELQTLPVVITADMTKAPPVIKVFAVNPWSELGGM